MRERSPRAWATEGSPAQCGVWEFWSVSLPRAGLCWSETSSHFFRECQLLSSKESCRNVFIPSVPNPAWFLPSFMKEMAGWLRWLEPTYPDPSGRRGESNIYLGTSFSTPNVHSPDWWLCTEFPRNEESSWGDASWLSHGHLWSDRGPGSKEERSDLRYLTPTHSPATGVPSPKHPSHFRDEKISVTYLLFGSCMNFLQLL